MCGSPSSLRLLSYELANESVLCSQFPFVTSLLLDTSKFVANMSPCGRQWCPSPSICPRPAICIHARPPRSSSPQFSIFWDLRSRWFRGRNHRNQQCGTNGSNGSAACREQHSRSSSNNGSAASVSTTTAGVSTTRWTAGWEATLRRRGATRENGAIQGILERKVQGAIPRNTVCGLLGAHLVSVIDVCMMSSSW